MSWGSKIAILYIGFVLMIAALIVRSSMENNDLVASDYYDKELHFQEQIDGSEALLNSGQKPEVNVTGGLVRIELPAGLSQQPKGKITFYRPDNAKQDQVFDITKSSSTFEEKKFVSGKYNVRIQWSNAGENYFFETTMYIP